MPDVPRPTRGGLDLIFAERPPGTDDELRGGYAGLVDDGALGELERGGFLERLRAEYGR